MKDFVQKLELVGFTARIKRLSESLMYDAKTIYKVSSLDIEPNWHLIFLLLKQEGELSVTQIAEILGFSHPAIIKITRKMLGQNYLISAGHPTDNRKKLLKLSEKSLDKLKEFEEEWKRIESVIQEVVDLEFLHKLGEVEEKLRTKKLLDRYKERISNE